MSDPFSKRAWTELQILGGLSPTSDSTVKFIIDSSPFDNEGSPSATNNTFLGRILPSSPPFNETALKIQIKLPSRYPAEPPEVRILTPIHHPNVFEDGNPS